MTLTRGGLQPAKIKNVTDGDDVECMFNPFEYTLTKQNQWEKKASKGSNTPEVRFKQGGSQVLKLKVYFDTLQTGSDVRSYTDKLWKMMMVTDTTRHAQSDKSAPPEVAFEWGRLYFKAVLTNMTQKFTLFDDKGTPVRCEVDLTLEQMIDVDDYGPQSPVAATAAQVAPKVAQMTSADRPDTIAAQNSGSPDATRDIMAANNINDPLKIPPGTPLNIPPGS
ncbi:MAG: hypothetical protein K8J31_26130 [Anaerolineae bacterium]|nr:hypothetical protein [Anaerolineae bacterium]